MGSIGLEKEKKQLISKPPSGEILNKQFDLPIKALSTDFHCFKASFYK